MRPGPGPSRVLLLVQVSTLKSSRLGRLSPNRQSIMKAWTRSSAQTSASRHLLAHTARCRVITIAKSTIHFSTVRSLQPPTNLSTPRQGRQRAEQKEEKTLFFDSMERIQRGVDEAVPQAAVVVEHQEQEDGVWGGGDTGPVRRGGGHMSPSRLWSSWEKETLLRSLRKVFFIHDGHNSLVNGHMWQRLMNVDHAGRRADLQIASVATQPAHVPGATAQS